MPESEYGTPSEDATAMLWGLKQPQDTVYGYHGMQANCAFQEIEVDPRTARIVWMTSLCTAVLIGAVHITRLVTAEKNMHMEIMVCLLGVAGAVTFLRDVYLCKVHQGMFKLILFLILANCIVPRLLVPYTADEFAGFETEEDTEDTVH